MSAELRYEVEALRNACEGLLRSQQNAIKVAELAEARASALLARTTQLEAELGAANRSREGLEAALTKLADHFKACAVHKGYTNAAQAVYRGVAHEMEVALAATRTEVAPTSDTGGVP